MCYFYFWYKFFLSPEFVCFKYVAYEHKTESVTNCVWNVMAHAQKPHFVFRQNGRVYLNRRGHQSSRLLAAEVCASVVVMLHISCSGAVWRILATHSIRQFPLHFPSRASPCAITFQLDSTFRFSDIVLFRFWILPHSPSQRNLPPSLESPRRFYDDTGLRVAKLLGATTFCYNIRLMLQRFKCSCYGTAAHHYKNHCRTKALDIRT